MSEAESTDKELSFFDGDKLYFRNYEVVRLKKKIQIDLGSQDESRQVDVSFAELRHNSTTVASFDGTYHPMGNETEFGMFNLLGDKSQLVVEETVWKGGRHWIYDLSGKRARLIFDSADWGASREDFGLLDLNSDGQIEVIKRLTDFYKLQDKFAMSLIPMPSVVFRYDPGRKKYLPANPLFPSHTLRDRLTIVTSANSDDMQEQAFIVSTLLDYVFAGKREKGWLFFERSYKADDKVALRNRLTSILRKQPVYRFIYERKIPQDAH